MNLPLKISVIIVFLAVGLQADEVDTLADFKTEATTLNWTAVNDGVMGGRSRGESFVTEASHLLFKGKISLENNGGFSSIRSSGKTQDLSNYAGIELKVKGDGRQYYLTARSDGRSRLAFWSPIQPQAGQWVTLRVPFESFYATSFGRKMSGFELNIEKVTSIGFMLYDKNDGRFQLEVQSIKAYKSAKQ
jgi:monofunctional biosynthetic peptidoglycan transglycosylase